MITLERTSVMNFENAVRGARNPMNSWANMDSCYDGDGNYVLGENDLLLTSRLRKAGPDHRKFLRQIFVSVDITAPLYWWKEFDTYKVATVANSTSTMHKITSKPIEVEDFSVDQMSEDAVEVFTDFVGFIEKQRILYLEMAQKAKESGRPEYAEAAKAVWWNIIQMLPSSYNQMRTITMNYETLINIYCARREHKQDEWRITFMDWLRTLPYAKELIIAEIENEERNQHG